MTEDYHILENKCPKCGNLLRPNTDIRNGLYTGEWIEWNECEKCGYVIVKEVDR